MTVPGIELNSERIFRKIESVIKELNLNLSGYTVLTEVGSGLYNWTPLIASQAGAAQVYACTRTSRHGNVEDIIKQCNKMLSTFVSESNVEFIEGKPDKTVVSTADIITNSGFLRPLDETLLQHANSRAVIPLMYEAWEWRKEDVDLDYCKIKDIPVAGTWESHPSLKVFQHIGPLAAKMAFNAGYEVFGNRILVWSGDEFGEVAGNYFRQMGALEVIVTDSEEELASLNGLVDFIYLANYGERRDYGKNGFFDFDRIKKRFGNPGIVHLFGSLELDDALRYFPIVYPMFNGRAKTMTFTLSEVGMNPFISLQVAGLKVGQALLENSSLPYLQPM